VKRFLGQHVVDNVYHGFLISLFCYYRRFSFSFMSDQDVKGSEFTLNELYAKNARTIRARADLRREILPIVIRCMEENQPLVECYAYVDFVANFFSQLYLKTVCQGLRVTTNGEKKVLARRILACGWEVPAKDDEVMADFRFQRSQGRDEEGDEQEPPLEEEPPLEQMDFGHDDDAPRMEAEPDGQEEGEAEASNESQPERLIRPEEKVQPNIRRGPILQRNGGRETVELGARSGRFSPLP